MTEPKIIEVQTGCVSARFGTNYCTFCPLSARCADVDGDPIMEQECSMEGVCISDCTTCPVWAEEADD